MLKKEIKLKVFNIRHGDEVGYGTIKVKISSTNNRFGIDLLKVTCDRYIMQHFDQRIFYLHREASQEMTLK